MQLKSGNMYSKLVASKKEKQVEYLRKNLECHRGARKFVEDYKQEKGMKSDDELPQQIRDQIALSDEMISLLPAKIDKIHYL